MGDAVIVWRSEEAPAGQTLRAEHIACHIRAFSVELGSRPGVLAPCSIFPSPPYCNDSAPNTGRSAPIDDLVV
jgi:hypothetical protein